MTHSSLYLRTVMHVPGVGSATHIAELEPIDATTCTLLRLIELDPSDTPRGALNRDTATQTERLAGGLPAPERVVPHPDTYADYPDVEVTFLDQQTFGAYWIEALTKFPELEDGAGQ